MDLAPVKRAKRSATNSHHTRNYDHVPAASSTVISHRPGNLRSVDSQKAAEQPPLVSRHQKVRLCDAVCSLAILRVCTPSISLRRDRSMTLREAKKSRLCTQIRMTALRCCHSRQHSLPLCREAVQPRPSCSARTMRHRRCQSRRQPILSVREVVKP